MFLVLGIVRFSRFFSGKTETFFFGDPLLVPFSLFFFLFPLESVWLNSLLLSLFFDWELLLGPTWKITSGLN
jgi:hypothetical protein